MAVYYENMETGEVLTTYEAVRQWTERYNGGSESKLLCFWDYYTVCLITGDGGENPPFKPCLIIPMPDKSKK